MDRVSQAVVEGWGWMPQASKNLLTMDYWQGWWMWGLSHHHALLLWLIVLLLILEWVARRKKRDDWNPGWWRGNMAQLFGSKAKVSPKKEWESLVRLQEDIIVNGVEEEVFKGNITREQAKKVYIHQADMAGLRGLLPRTDQKVLKTTLQDKHTKEKGTFLNREPIIKTETA